MLQLFELLGPHLIAAVLAMTRMLAALIVLPLFSSQNLPRTVRTATAFALSMMLVPELAANAAIAQFSLLAVGLLLKEVALGILLGFSFGMIFWAVENIGHLIDFQTGLTFSQTVDPLVGNQTSVHARLLTQFFFVYFVAVGGLRQFLEAMYASYRIWPVTTGVPHMRTGWQDMFSDQVGLMFSLTLLFCAGAMIILLLVDLAMGLLNRAAPNMAIYDMMRPLKSWLATLVVLVTLPFMVERTLEAIQRYRGVTVLLQRMMG